MKRTTNYKSQEQIIDIIFRKAWTTFKSYKDSDLDSYIFMEGQYPNRLYTWVKSKNGASIGFESFQKMIKEDILLQIQKDKTCFLYIDPYEALIQIEDDRPGINGIPIDINHYVLINIAQTDIKFYVYANT